MKKVDPNKNIYSYTQRDEYVLEVKDTYLHRLAQEQGKLINMLKGREVRHFDNVYEELIDRINAEEI